jgi:lysophospholipase L1-like esterase
MIRVALPSTRVSLIAAAPNPARWSQRVEQEAFNAMMKAYATRYGHDYIDVWTPMMGEDGTPSRDIYRDDRLHLNEAGYELWRGVVGPFLTPEPR